MFEFLKQKTPKICLYCEHFNFDHGSPEYSEETPGYSWSMWCWESKWEIDGEDYPTQEEFIERLHGTCEKWEKAKWVENLSINE